MNVDKAYLNKKNEFLNKYDFNLLNQDNINSKHDHNANYLDMKNNQNNGDKNNSNNHIIAENAINMYLSNESKEKQNENISNNKFLLLNNSKTTLKNKAKDSFDKNNNNNNNSNNINKEDEKKILDIIPCLLDNQTKLSELTYLEETFNKIGYRRYQIICIIISLICITSYGINLTIYASMVIPIKTLFKLTHFELSLISSMLYIGTGFGHFVTGFVTKSFTRRHTVIFLLFIISLLSFFIGFLNGKYSFALFRLLIGMGIGTLLPLVVNNLLEFLPLFYKGLFIMIAFLGVYLGQLIPNFLMFKFIPELNEKNVGIVQVISSTVSFVALILAYFLFENSPISLVIKKEYTNALLLIEKMDYKNAYTLEKKKMLLNEMASKFCIKGKNNYLKSLFEPKFKKTSILLTIIWLINSILFFGPAIIVSITIDKLGISIDKKTIILNQISIILIGISGFLIGGFISEIKSIGRLKTIMLGYLFLILFVYLTIIIPEKFTIFYGLAYASIPLFYFMTMIYTAEFFPSRLRDLALGFFYSINKIGGLISQFLFIILAQLNINFPFYVIIILSVVNIVCLMLLDFETLEKGMDFMEKLD